MELIDAGDQVVAVAKVTGTGPTSQIAMEDRDQFAFLFTIKNGRCVREQAFRNREEAQQLSPYQTPGNKRAVRLAYAS